MMLLRFALSILTIFLWASLAISAPATSSSMTEAAPIAATSIPDTPILAMTTTAQPTWGASFSSWMRGILRLALATPERRTERLGTRRHRPRRSTPHPVIIVTSGCTYVILSAYV
ncbi:hypothetical protein CYLTODRAFT_440430 [Cylindrobasidium torrendii FP15055 ss-10]|uniref:Secreted protein n=1 Tax=Cylindrobasidium torrendii FP15055 ss-10 TaxID=1314674 RepID=A0A0D7BQK0_9AGAR|nr:hypothetical protein CYLTODRAFT_440430 [Cylindrobasidium torrendii FP15055 ss-10]